jgi:hypothetical protein
MEYHSQIPHNGYRIDYTSNSTPKALYAAATLYALSNIQNMWDCSNFRAIVITVSAAFDKRWKIGYEFKWRVGHR